MTNKVPAQAEKIWREIIEKLQIEWKTMQSQTDRDQIEDSLDELIDGLEQYRLGKAACKARNRYVDKCLQQIETVYRDNMQKAFDKYIAPEHWCQRGASRSFLKLVNGEYINSEQPGQLQCKDVSRQFLRTRMLQAKGIQGAQFETWEAFVARKPLAEKVRKMLAPKGIKVPNGYRLRSHKSFIKGASSELSEQLQQSFSQQAKQSFGKPVPPLLSAEAFFAQDLIQTPLKSALKLPAEHAPVALNLSKKQFHDQILIPTLQRELGKERQRLLASASRFADGADKEHEGKQYVRGILVPPVAMGFSMLLMQAGASAQWQADKQLLAEHPEIAFHSLGQTAGDAVEQDWNKLDDQLTCGKNNKDIQLVPVNTAQPHGEHRYQLANTPNENLLKGRSLLQRLLFNTLMAKSSFETQQEAQQASGVYAHLACVGGRSRKATAFMGGIAINGKDKLTKYQDVAEKSLKFMQDLEQWAQKKL